MFSLENREEQVAVAGRISDAGPASEIAARSVATATPILDTDEPPTPPGIVTEDQKVTPEQFSFCFSFEQDSAASQDQIDTSSKLSGTPDYPCVELPGTVSDPAAPIGEGGSHQTPSVTASPRPDGNSEKKEADSFPVNELVKSQLNDRREQPVDSPSEVRRSGPIDRIHDLKIAGNSHVDCAPEGTAPMRSINPSECAADEILASKGLGTIVATDTRPEFHDDVELPTHSDKPNDDVNEAQVDPHKPIDWAALPTLDLRGDDVKIQSVESLIEPYRNDLKIYLALYNLADAGQKGTRVDDETWEIRIGYTEIRRKCGCTTRALGRAWPRLRRLGIVVCTQEHKDRRENMYTVRKPEWLLRMYTESGCTHYRFVKGVIQPFRPRSEAPR